MIDVECVVQTFNCAKRQNICFEIFTHFYSLKGNIEKVLMIK